MPFRFLALAISFMTVLGGCASSNLTGSTHTIIFRPQPTPNFRLQGTHSLIRASDWNGYVLRGKALSQAVADPQNGTLRFTLPTIETVQSNSPTCLMIVGPSGQVPVRNSSTGKFTFRNPFWEEEISRLGSRKQASQTVDTLRADAASVRTRVDVVFRELQGYNARSIEECRESPPVPPPPRPITAVAVADRPVKAAQVCAAAWEEALKETAGKLYAAAKASEVWNQRTQGSDLLRELNIHMTPDSQEIAGWELAVAQGNRFLQYDEYLALFKARTNEYEKAAIQRFIDQTKQWEEKVAYAAATPQRLFQQCKEVGTTHRQLSLELSNIEAKMAQAKAELNRMRDSTPRDLESKSLADYTCTDR